MKLNQIEHRLPLQGGGEPVNKAAEKEMRDLMRIATFAYNLGVWWIAHNIRQLVLEEDYADLCVYEQIVGELIGAYPEDGVD